MQFDQLVDQLLEYWDRYYSDAGNLVQRAKMPAIAQPLISGDLFPQSAVERNNHMGKGDHSQRKEVKKPKKEGDRKDRKQQKKKSR